MNHPAHLHVEHGVVASVSAASRAQEAVHFVDENDGRRQLPGQREHGGHLRSGKDPPQMRRERAYEKRQKRVKQPRTVTNENAAQKCFQKHKSI